uniref:L1 transposable element RRM domain-containing protein n=1 Tax=Astatotilapia calliptera TaxID=8154 RepID=A0A3P8NW59_ASTCA
MSKRGVKAKASSDLVASNCPEKETMCDAEDALSTLRDDVIVDKVTSNISKYMDIKISEVIKPINELTEKFDNLIERMETVEQRVSDLEDVTATNEPRIAALETQLKKAMERLESFENQSRRQNVRIVGLKEGAEGRAPVDFFKKWIPEVLGLQQGAITVDRAHRTGPPMRLTGTEGPRAVLVRLHYYTDTQRILQAARAKGTVNTEAGKVSFYQDFSAEVARKRKESANKDLTHIAFLQETHLTDDEHRKYCREWVGQIFFSSYSTNKRGVITLIHKNLPFNVIATHKDNEGRYILVKGMLHGETVLL